MQHSFLDHITVTAFSLDAGAALLRETLGATPQVGGEHPSMATHNLLLRLGDAMFLEVIAPHPTMPPPARPRWFALDDLKPGSPASLSTWVVRTTDMQASMAAASEPLGAMVPVSRGNLRWLMGFPSDGTIALHGAGPALIEWQTDQHPAAGLKDQGLSLDCLEILHPDPQRVSQLLASLHLDAPVTVQAAAPQGGVRLRAHIRTPQGLRVLSTDSALAPYP
ncbi:MAG: VOC family protein [Comamonas sp.]